MRSKRDDESMLRFTMLMCSDIEEKENPSLADSFPTCESIIDYQHMLDMYSVRENTPVINMGTLLEMFDEGVPKDILHGYIAKHGLKWFVSIQPEIGHVIETFSDEDYEAWLKLQPIIYMGGA